MKIPGRTDRWQILRLWAAVLLILVPGVMAPGVMPAHGVDGPTMVLCTADGPVTMATGLTGDGQEDTDRHSAVGLCPFAAGQVLAALLPVPCAACKPAPQSFSITLPLAEIASITRVRLSPQSRAPPSVGLT